MTDAPGPEIEGLTLLGHLGSGGYANVYLYERRSPRMKVAVKVLNERKLSPTELAQFEAEAETMAELADHPYIVQVFSADRTSEGRPYLVMKYYPRDNLARRAANERFSVAEALRIGVKISSAVETAHRAKILHRDIKPANILGSQYGEPGLTDFGIAGRASDTDDGEELGVSVPWTSPEVLTGSSNGTVQSDVYSLAATVWNLLVGRSPFEIPDGDNSYLGFFGRIVNLPPPDTGRPDVPDSLNRLLRQAMAKNPAQRPRSALEFAQALQAIEQEQRFGRTEIVVDGFGPGVENRARSDSDGDDATRAKAQRVVAQHPPRRADGAKAEPATVDRPGLVRTAPSAHQKLEARDRVLPNEAEFPSTMRRDRLPDSGAVTDVAARHRRGVRRRTAVLAASALAVAAVVVAVVLTSGGSSKHADTIPSQRATVQTDVPALAASPPTVTATYNRATQSLTFSWRVSDPQRGDSYAWSVADSPQDTTRISSPRLSLKSTRPASTCIRVSLIRSDGSASPPSDPVCGPRA